MFPKDASNRHFDTSHFNRVLPTGQTVDRRWLVYSISKDRIYCFGCKLFPTTETVKKVGQLASDGFRDWHNLTRALKSHEKNPEHTICLGRWLELEYRFKKNATIDSMMELLMNEERAHWREVLTRIIAIVTTLAKSTLPFRRRNEKLYEENNGLFLQFVEMVAKFDPVTKEHIRSATSHEIQYTYLGKEIKNELIQLLAGEVKKTILDTIKQAIFFSIILDCTPDASHEEQMSLVIRCVNGTASPVVVQEFWLAFLKVDDTTGLGLFTELKRVLVELELNIDDIRGRGYDNGSNMSEKYKGVQSRLLEINLRAFYTPCGCHNLNLTLCDMVRCSQRAKDFFVIIQRIYNLFSVSTKRWSIFKDRVSGLTLKPLSTTRWESHIEAIKPLKCQLKEIVEALDVLGEDHLDDHGSLEARNLRDNFVLKFEFLVSLAIWFGLLHVINDVSKCLQVENVDIELATGMLGRLSIFLEGYRREGFDRAMGQATEQARDLGVEAVFEEKRIIRRTRHFDEIPTKEMPQSAKEAFRVDYFLCVVDQALFSVNTRFEHLKSYKETFGFLYDVQRLRDMPLHELEKYLEQYLRHEGRSDIDADKLYGELTALQIYILDETMRAIEVLEFTKSFLNSGMYSQTYVAYQITLTIPVTVASAERSFSKLKLLKTYLRSKMTQERLNGLAMISIEKEIVNKLDLENLISVFASKTAKRVVFKEYQWIR